LQATGGIFVWAGNSNIITQNQLTNNYEGIYIGYDSQAQQNVITGNNIENNSYGIVMSSANNNIYKNNFTNNTIQVYLYGEIVNVWDHDKRGNFWSDYNGTDADGDSVGDTPYVIDVNNQDNYPLKYPWGAPAVTVFSLENSTHGGFLLNFSVNKPAVWMGYSLDAEANVTVTGNMTLNGLATGLHNITVYAIDLYGTSGASNTVTFTIEPQPFPTVTIAVVSAATVIMVGICLLVYFRKRNH
jgi:parallel beta-helix repeat protein